MADTLCGQRILVTRPAHQQAHLCQRLAELGAEPVSLPLLEIEPVTDADGADFQRLKQAIIDLDLYQKVILVSPNAARLAHHWIDQWWPQLPLGIMWIAIGKQTAQALAKLGIDAWHAGSGFDSETLLAAEPMQQVAGERILILRGNGGRELMHDTFTARGARVDHVTVYYRRCPRYAQTHIETRLYDSPLAAIFVSSGEGLQNLLSIGQIDTRPVEQLLSTLLIVPSTRVAELATSLGFNHVRTAAGPDDQAMIQALLPVNPLE